MSTSKQKLAQTENFALFQLKSMRSNLVHLRNIKGEVPDYHIEMLKHHIEAMIFYIKRIQLDRKHQNESNLST